MDEMSGTKIVILNAWGERIQGIQGFPWQCGTSHILKNNR
jgi:hypothetical protein